MQPRNQAGINVTNAPLKTSEPACITTLSAARAAAAGIADRAEHTPGVRSLQEYHRDEQLGLRV